MTSYQLSERLDIHALLFYGLALPLCRATVAIENAWRFIRAALPHLLFALAILAKVLGLVAIVAGLVAATAMIPVQFWAGLLVIGAFGLVTYPRRRRAFGATCSKCGAILYEDGFCPRCRK